MAIRFSKVSHPAIFLWKRVLLWLLFLPTVFTYAQTNSVTVVSLSAIPGLRYDRVRFTVKPGSTIRIVLTNADEMSHNLVITEPGAREEVVQQASALGTKGPAMNYIPTSSKVLWSISEVDPGQSKSITFTVPGSVGVYPYVCTFPGHGVVMYGAMYVTDGGMPPMRDDLNIPPNRKEQVMAGDHDRNERHSMHPYRPVPPYVYRILMPDAGPAAIAVSLPQKLSYCWDAGACRLRYAWQGDFIDPIDYWDKKGERFAKILGTVFYRDKTEFPLRVDEIEHIPTVNFKGYRLVKSYPEFHYTLDEMDVFELILPKEDGTGLERTFRIPKASKPIWFTFDLGDGVHYATSAGKFIDGKLKLSPQEAEHFTITMTRTEGEKL
ncbi:MAG: plastocyanin/azurin family copper-binding protein [Cyclobacteriaceae bacterium]|jgi:plastocyanin|nr:plastocyanin/azurin family copper-binding protein [Cyclobacteriaceae bacterium]MDH4296958.1 plastocyanin/azurin family copper-binding protein [Cyclobacteriaceae bacterium]MDH5251346.1 plastocyanin/azurin family copper-binding protein [Cyclobacteriaceae bacterium]